MCTVIQRLTSINGFYFLINCIYATVNLTLTVQNINVCCQQCSSSISHWLFFKQIHIYLYFLTFYYKLFYFQKYFPDTARPEIASNDAVIPATLPPRILQRHTALLVSSKCFIFYSFLFWKCFLISNETSTRKKKKISPKVTAALKVGSPITLICNTFACFSTGRKPFYL